MSSHVLNGFKGGDPTAFLCNLHLDYTILTVKTVSLCTDGISHMLMCPLPLVLSVGTSERLLYIVHSRSPGTGPALCLGV